jgi:hypothetical protein
MCFHVPTYGILDILVVDDTGEKKINFFYQNMVIVTMYY